MRWKLEIITSDSCNILIDDEAKSDMDKDPVGMGFPHGIAERLVKLHNESLEDIAEYVVRAEREELLDILQKAVICNLEKASQPSRGVQGGDKDTKNE